MNHTVHLEQFEGPLDLLLKLIEDEKLDITTISLAKITDPYLAYIEREEELPADEVADFLVVAAKLIYIKSKYLLPSLELEEEEGGDLEMQLKMYREYFEASKEIERMIRRKHFSFVRESFLKLEREVGFSPPANLAAALMPGILAGVLGRIEKIMNLPKLLLQRTVSIKEKIEALRNAIQRGMVMFHTLYERSNKQDMIISFLALLELVKARRVEASQPAIFAEITISRASHE